MNYERSSIALIKVQASAGSYFLTFPRQFCPEIKSFLRNYWSNRRPSLWFRRHAGWWQQILLFTLHKFDTGFHIFFSGFYNHSTPSSEIWMVWLSTSVYIFISVSLVRTLCETVLAYRQTEINLCKTYVSDIWLGWDFVCYSENVSPVLFSYTAIFES